MQVFEAIFGWIGSNEAVLSGIAACIVIVGVAYRPIRRLLPGRSAPSEAAARAGRDVAPTSPEAAYPALVDDRPSVAVVPFSNLSNEAAQEFLADGLTEDVILGLSRVKQLFVIARNSCFTYKGRAVDAGQVSRELGVRYVLEGSVRRNSDRVRVTAQLVDATTRESVWSNRFDRPVEEITQVDDEVTEEILAALLPALRRVEAEQAGRAAPEDLNAWALVNRAWVTVQSDLGDEQALQEAASACREAIRHEPDHAFAHAVLGLALSLLTHMEPPRHGDPEAEEVMRRALTLGPDDSLVHHCHAAMCGNFGRTEEGLRAWQRAIDLDPNSAGARAGLGIAQIFLREPARALENIDGALRRSPRDPIAYHWLAHRAFALSLMGNTADAEQAARTSIDQRASRIGLAVLAGVLAERDDMEGALDCWDQLTARQTSVDAAGIATLAAPLAPDPDRGAEMTRILLMLGEAAAARHAAS